MPADRLRAVGIGVVLLLAPCGQLEGQDRWFAKDKAQHFVASAVIATGGYLVGTRVWDSKRAGLLLGAGLSLSAGIAKEWSDSRGLGQASWKDMVWNVVGIATALGISWALDPTPARRTEPAGTTARAMERPPRPMKLAPHVEDPVADFARWARLGSKPGR